MTRGQVEDPESVSGPASPFRPPGADRARASRRRAVGMEHPLLSSIEIRIEDAGRQPSWPHSLGLAGWRVKSVSMAPSTRHGRREIPPAKFHVPCSGPGLAEGLVRACRRRRRRIPRHTDLAVGAGEQVVPRCRGTINFGPPPFREEADRAHNLPPWYIPCGGFADRERHRDVETNNLDRAVTLDGLDMRLTFFLSPCVAANPSRPRLVRCADRGASLSRGGGDAGEKTRPVEATRDGAARRVPGTDTSATFVCGLDGASPVWYHHDSVVIGADPVNPDDVPLSRAFAFVVRLKAARWS